MRSSAAGAPSGIGARWNLPKKFGKKGVEFGDFDLVLAAANLHD